MMWVKWKCFHIICILLSLTTLPEKTTCGKAREKRRRSPSPSSVAPGPSQPRSPDILSFLEDFVDKLCSPPGLQSVAIGTRRPSSPSSPRELKRAPKRRQVFKKAQFAVSWKNRYSP
ncbi:uncharacterized protein LOC119373198 [Rhipicephalus sanguineus]|uniref:uncharacterized protein LOC119373198 n=1 Tax=Rhipicephalus sanguineus TaxID=34632 RepID=UPI0020C3BF0B|nr:uncharacterized protein LOC119373198 [Rhipicephalus sanguineus]